LGRFQLVLRSIPCKSESAGLAQSFLLTLSYPGVGNFQSLTAGLIQDLCIWCFNSLSWRSSSCVSPNPQCLQVLVTPSPSPSPAPTPPLVSLSIRVECISHAFGQRKLVGMSWVSGIFLPVTAQAESLLHRAEMATVGCPIIVLEVLQGAVARCPWWGPPVMAEA